MNGPNPPQPNFQYTPPLPTSTLAIVSIIAGVLGFTAMPVLGGIVALITGYLARRETRAVPPRATGDGLATAGIVMGYIQIALIAIGLCCFVLYFVLVGGLIFAGGGSGH